MYFYDTISCRIIKTQYSLNIIKYNLSTNCCNIALYHGALVLTNITSTIEHFISAVIILLCLAVK